MNPNQWLKIAGLQTNIAWEDKTENFRRIRNLVDPLNDIDLYILPETFTTGFTMRSEAFAEKQEGETETFLHSLAIQKNAYFGGSWIEKNAGLPPFNTFSIVGKDGVVARYRKIHPFSFAKEDLFFTSGKEVLTFTYKGFQICPLICYDLRFPETFRKVVGSDLYIVIGNWPSSRIFAWVSLLKARAIENQAYVVGVNRVGVAGRKEKIFHNGYSCYFSPQGEEKILQSEQEDVLRVSLSIEELSRFRDFFPYLKDIKKI